MRPIDADALREQLQNLAYDDWNQGVSTSWADAYRAVADMVEDTPTIEPVRMKGKWIKQVDESINAWWHECSVCGDYPLKDAFGHDSLSQFCPLCGALMSEGEENEKA